MIPPEEVFQHSQQYFHAYRPIVEELFKVDLSDLLLKDTEGYLLDELVDRGVPEEDVSQMTRLQSLFLIAGTAARYWDKFHSVYIFSHRPRSDESLAQTVVHELGHAAHYRLMRQDRAVYLCQETIWKIVKEGFAKYVELEKMAPHYNLPEMGVSLSKDRQKYLGRFESCVDDFRRDYSGRPLLRRLITRFLPPEEQARVRDNLLREFFEGHKLFRYAAGYHLFRKSQECGVPLEEVLRNPPKDLESIIDPTEYIKEMTS